MDRKLQEEDLVLIEAARDAIRRNYDGINENHTVGAALRCSDGRIFTGENIYSIHGACAEVIALGAAVTAGERNFSTIVAVRGENGEEILPPCGNCRQMLSEYAPECMVILNMENGPGKIMIRDLLPYAYKPSAE